MCPDVGGRMHGKPCQNRPVCSTQLDFLLGNEYLYQDMDRNNSFYDNFPVNTRCREDWY